MCGYGQTLREAVRQIMASRQAKSQCRDGARGGWYVARPFRSPVRGSSYDGGRGRVSYYGHVWRELGVLNWLHARHAGRDARAPHANAAVARTSALLRIDAPEADADLVGQAGSRGDPAAPEVANDASWAPPLRLSW